MDETNHHRRSRETDRCATTRTRVRGVCELPLMQKDPQLSKRKRTPTARITVAKPPFTQWIALNSREKRRNEGETSDDCHECSLRGHVQSGLCSYQHGAPPRRGSRGDFDRINREKLLDILIEEENPGFTLFSFDMC